MARKEDKQPQYLPLIVKAKLHTGGRDYEKIKEELKGQGLPSFFSTGHIRKTITSQWLSYVHSFMKNIPMYQMAV